MATECDTDYLPCGCGRHTWVSFHGGNADQFHCNRYCHQFTRRFQRYLDYKYSDRQPRVLRGIVLGGIVLGWDRSPRQRLWPTSVRRQWGYVCRRHGHLRPDSRPNTLGPYRDNIKIEAKIRSNSLYPVSIAGAEVLQLFHNPMNLLVYFF